MKLLLFQMFVLILLVGTIISCLESDHFDLPRSESLSITAQTRSDCKIQCEECSSVGSLNYSFEVFSLSQCPNRTVPFPTCVNDWDQFMGTPHIQDEQSIFAPGIITFPSGFDQDWLAALALIYDDGEYWAREGIMVNQNFYPDEDITYCMKFLHAKGDYNISGTSSFIANTKVYAANNVSPTTTNNYDFNIANEDAELITSVAPTSQWSTVRTDFKVENTFSQLLVFPDEGNYGQTGRYASVIGIDKVEIFCCSNAVTGVDISDLGGGFYQFSPILSIDTDVNNPMWTINGQVYTTAEPVVSLATGMYTLELTYTNTRGCSGVHCQDIYVGYERCDYSLCLSTLDLESGEPCGPGGAPGIVALKVKLPTGQIITFDSNLNGSGNCYPFNFPYCTGGVSSADCIPNPNNNSDPCHFNGNNIFHLICHLQQWLNCNYYGGTAFFNDQAYMTCRAGIYEISNSAVEMISVYARQIATEVCGYDPNDIVENNFIESNCN